MKEISKKNNNEYIELFKTGNAAQLKKMIENENEKSGWDDIDLDYAMEEITINLECMERYENGKYFDLEFIRGNLDEMLLEKAANIANFAHMIIYTLSQEIIK